jgi:hypothetical protein
MAWRNISVVMAPEDENGQEQFYLVQFESALQPSEPGYIRDRQGPLREAVLRDFLRTFGQTTEEIEALFRTARSSRPSMKNKTSGGESNGE